MDFSRFQVQAVDAAIGMGDGIGIGSASGSGSGKAKEKGNVFPLKSILNTRKGKKMYVDIQNFEYIVNRIVEKPTGTQINLRCAEYNRQRCKAVARFYTDRSETITLLVDHNHVSDAADVSAKILVKKYMDSAVNNPTVEPRTAYAQMMASRVLLPTERMCIPDRVSIQTETFNYCISINISQFISIHINQFIPINIHFLYKVSSCF